jgi:hypothetical protein
MVTQTQNANGTWSTVNLNCIAAPPARQDPVDAAAKEAFTKLVPHVTISAAAQNGVSIVNIETLYWLGTPATVDLGTTPLLGHPVRLLATVQTVQWSFGDGHSATSQGPGRPFTADDYCNTKICPDWFGHTYTEPSRKLTVSATATWTGRYSIDGGPFIAITGTVASPATTIDMEVEQSLSILVPNPGETS